MKTSNRWLGLFGAAVIASSVSVSAYSSSTTGCIDDWMGDGYCDDRNNSELCSKYSGREKAALLAFPTYNAASEVQLLHSVGTWLRVIYISFSTQSVFKQKKTTAIVQNDMKTSETWFKWPNLT